MANRSAVWFSLPAPDHHLGCGSGSHAAQTAAAMRGFERVLLGGQPGDRPPDLVLVVGDVDSTLAEWFAWRQAGGVRSSTDTARARRM